MRTENEQIVHLEDYRPAPYRIPQVELRVEIGPETTRVISLLTIEPAENTPRDTPLMLDGDELSLNAIAVDGAPLGEDFYETTPAGLVIFSPPPRRFVLETDVTLSPDTNTELMGLYRSNGIWCTQCEPEGFRRITYFLDRPDILSRYRVTMSADRMLAPTLLANGNCIDAGELPEGWHFTTWDDPHLKPSYLFAMVAGNLGSITDSYTTMSGREVALAIHCEPGKQEQCAYAMDALKRAMAWDERRFGREYDLDVFNVVAVSDFNFGAMENKGLNIFNDRYVLARPETATDADYAHIESVIAHEYFHNWTGNRITCRDWFQLCLKEGLTVFRDQEFTSDERSRAVKRIEDVRTLRMAQFPEDTGPLAHPARPNQYREINNFYTATVYEKGAEIVRMLATLLGEDEFRKGMDLYFERHDGQAITIEDWLQVFMDATGRDLEQFGKWYTQAGTPEVTVDEDWDEESQTYRLHLAQRTAPTPGQKEKAPMVLPIKFGLIGANGQPASWSKVTGGKVRDDMIVMDTPELELIFDAVSKRPVPSLFRGFSAPVRLTTQVSQADKLFLARSDTDPFNRWQALQDISMNLMLDAARAGGAFADREAIHKLAQALDDTLENAEMDAAFKAHALTLPSEINVAQTLAKDVDPAIIHSVRRDLLKTISGELYDKLHGHYEALEAESQPDSIAPGPTRARALRNQCLSLLVAGGSDAATELAKRHYREARNMTDRMAALGALVANWSPGTDALLDDFGKEFASDMLVYDKWLALNAMMPEDGCLRRVQEIYADPAFPRTNPNRLRALVGTFAMQNAAQFTRPDGAGFRFVTEFCKDVDGRNPQVAARVLTAFRSWANLEPTRRAAAKTALDSMAAAGGLSRNTSDILDRTIEG